MLVAEKSTVVSSSKSNAIYIWQYQAQRPVLAVQLKMSKPEQLHYSIAPCAAMKLEEP